MCLQNHDVLLLIKQWANGSANYTNFNEHYTYADSVYLIVLYALIS